MFEGFEQRAIMMDIPRLRREWEEFLMTRGLTPVENPKFVTGFYDSEDKLVATGALVETSSGFIMQAMAVDSAREGEGLMGKVVDSLKASAAQIAGSNSVQNFLLFTKPEYEERFQPLGFRRIGRAKKAILMESSSRGLSGYKSLLHNLLQTGHNGVVVMNANPFTLGHRYLIEKAAEQVDNLYIIPVLDDTKGGFSYTLRRQIMTEALRDIDNVIVTEGSRYAVSAATFPTYFIKEVTDRTETQITLDLDIFANHIAPSLNAEVRFVGSEPADALTATYNAAMHSLLPSKGIKVVETERFCIDGKPVSATLVRSLLAVGEFVAATRLIPAETMAWILASKACDSLREELDSNPKPGLVTPYSSGSHTDMDYTRMISVVDALMPYFAEMALMGLCGSLTHEKLVHTGLDAEECMVQITEGVNTHRGAIFAIGLAVCSAAVLIGEGQNPEPKSLSDTISNLAEPFVAQLASNGAKARKMNLPSALEMAKSGYKPLFENWLPFFRALPSDDSFRLQKLLLRIMETLSDTNIYHRGGREALEYVMAMASELSVGFTEGKFCSFCDEMQKRNLSPGGAADMLSLTLFIDKISKNN